MEHVLEKNGDRFWLMVIPGDGDCLFGSIVHQIYGMTPAHPLFKSYSHQIRITAVAEIRRNLPYYYDQVASHAADECLQATDELLQYLSVSDQVEWYLAKLETPGFWGGEESISALANHYQVIFTLHQEEGTAIEFRPSDSGMLHLPRYDLYYRSLAPPVQLFREIESNLPRVKTHYDSVVCIRKAGSTLDRSTGVIVQLPSLNYPVRVRWFGDNPDGSLLCIIHQLARSEPSEEILYKFRCLIADEVDDYPTSLDSCVSPESNCNLSFPLRAERRGENRAAFVVLSRMLNINIFVHDIQEEDSMRYSPTVSHATINVHIVADFSQAVPNYGSIFCAPDIFRTARTPASSDHMTVAQRAARKEATDSQLTEPSVINVDPKQGLRFASLNVNGCRREDKRESIDGLLLCHGVHIAALQEVNLDCMYVATSNFRWYVGESSNTNRKRGLAILIRHGLNAEIRNSLCSKPSIQHAEILYQVCIC